MKEPARLTNLYPHQKAALRNITRHFVTHRRTRGKFISACGSGKTMVMSMLPFSLSAHTTAFMVPNLNLIAQTWRAFQEMLGEDWFDGFIVCSDDSLRNGGKPTRNDQDSLVEDQSEEELASQFHGQVLREPAEIASALDGRSSGRPLIVFSTYQSSHLLLEGVQASRAGTLDLLLADEAHNLVSGSDNGVKAAKAGSHQRTVILDLPATRRLFATATPKAVKSVKRRTIFSMDNKAQFGDEAHRYTYAEAVRDRVVSPVEIVICQVDPGRESEFLDAARAALPEGDARHQIRATGVVSHDDVRSLSVANGVAALLSKGRVNSMLTYSHRIKRAEHNAEDINRVAGDGTATALSSKDSTPRRQAVVEQLRDGSLPVITNCQLFTEGHDTPALDGIAFVDPKKSASDIVQAIGRACRQPYGKENKRAVLLLPVDTFNYDQSGNIIFDGKSDVVAVDTGAAAGDPFGVIEAVVAALQSPGFQLWDASADFREQIMRERKTKPGSGYIHTVPGPFTPDLVLDAAGGEAALPEDEPAAGLTTEELDALLADVPDPAMSDAPNPPDLRAPVIYSTINQQGEVGQLDDMRSVLAEYLRLANVDLDAVRYFSFNSYETLDQYVHDVLMHEVSADTLMPGRLAALAYTRRLLTTAAGIDALRAAKQHHPSSASCAINGRTAFIGFPASLLIRQNMKQSVDELVAEIMRAIAVGVAKHKVGHWLTKHNHPDLIAEDPHDFDDLGGPNGQILRTAVRAYTQFRVASARGYLSPATRSLLEYLDPRGGLLSAVMDHRTPAVVR